VRKEATENLRVEEVEEERVRDWREILCFRLL
jgi:hypothetical protein